MIKKLLFILILCCLLYTPVSAENSMIINYNYHTTAETIDIDISISNNPGIAAFDFTLNFDNSVLSPISIQSGIMDNIVSNIQADNISDLDFVSAVMASPHDFNENGTLFTIKFKIKDKKATSATMDLSGTMCNQKQESMEIENTKQTIKINQNGGYSVSSGSFSSSIKLKTNKHMESTDNSITNVHQGNIVNFNDISDVLWANEAIISLYENGIIKGTSETTFSPNANITRADFIILLIRKLGLNANFSENFEDVSSTMYYYQDVGIAKALDIAVGVGENRFNPHENISRQDMFVLAYRALLKSNKIDGVESETLERFIDKEQIDDYAKNALSALANNEYIQGNNGYINPQNKATRAEAVVFIYRLQ